ncbi:MAG: AtpZ/AtpI family protein [Gemmatimonadota bacterium]|nr:AtpZ/AtpI family protein [Gemmatimonadota bacterium]HEU4990848.1 AtpZ/AtpI family protein [Gemmatimonadaceae bacterium]
MDRDRESRHGRDAGKSPLQRRSIPTGAEFAGIGLQFGLTIVVFVFAGVWLDARLHTSPWLVIVCTFAGAFGGFYSIYRRVMAVQQRNERKPE